VTLQLWCTCTAAAHGSKQTKRAIFWRITSRVRLAANWCSSLHAHARGQAQLRTDQLNSLSHTHVATGQTNQLMFYIDISQNDHIHLHATDASPVGITTMHLQPRARAVAQDATSILVRGRTDAKSSALVYIQERRQQAVLCKRSRRMLEYQWAHWMEGRHKKQCKAVRRSRLVLSLQRRTRRH
jgi:hypothetical protein